MKAGISNRLFGIMVTGLCLAMATTASAASDSLLTVTEEAQILPIEDGSQKYLLKSDGFYCLGEDGKKHAAAAVHYFDHVTIDGTVFSGYYYHDETGQFKAAQSHMAKLSGLNCTGKILTAGTDGSSSHTAEETDESSGQEETVNESEQTFDGLYMVNNLGKLNAAPQVRYMDQLVSDKVTYDGYYFFNEYGRLVTETGIHELHMTSNGRTFDGDYYFGGTNGVLSSEAGVTEDGFPYDADGKISGTDDLGMDTLEPQLESMLSGYDGTWSVYVKDLETEEEILLNNTPLYSASLIKAFVMAKTYEDMDIVLQNEAAQLKTTADDPNVQVKVDDLLWNMITVSDNESCNELGRLQSDAHDFLKGAAAVNRYLKWDYPDTSFQSTLHPSSSQTISLGGHNTTTVKDCGALLEKIYRGECVSEEASAKMLELLKNQENTTKIPAALSDDVVTANKTGETSSDEHDIAIVYGPKTTYILCVMSEDFKSDSAAIENIRSISRVVYNYLNL